MPIAELDQYDGGTWSSLDVYAAGACSDDTWYDVYAKCEGSHVEVWRGVSGGSASLILSTDSATETTSAKLVFGTDSTGTFRYDDLRLSADDSTTTTTFAVTDGNELSTQTDYNGTITFGYDAWGRMTTKSRGSQDTAYAWHYGGKLTSVTSDFPGEGTVTYAYGGDGKRRERDDGTVTKYNWGRGETLLNEEGSNSTLAMTHIGALASVSGSTPSSGSYQYHSMDIRATNRMTRDQSKAALGSNEYDPLGASVARQGAQPLAGYAGHLWDPVAALMFSSPQAPGLGRGLKRTGGSQVELLEADPPEIQELIKEANKAGKVAKNSARFHELWVAVRNGAAIGLRAVFILSLLTIPGDSAPPTPFRDKSLAEPDPEGGYKAPGICLSWYYNQLDKDYHDKCDLADALGNCNPGDTFDVMKEKREAFNACAQARNFIMKTCLDGGNKGHQQARDQFYRRAEKCEEHANRQYHRHFR